MPEWLHAAIRAGHMEADKTTRPMTIAREEVLRFQRECILPLIDENTRVRDSMSAIGSCRDPTELSLIKAGVEGCTFH